MRHSGRISKEPEIGNWHIIDNTMNVSMQSFKQFSAFFVFTAERMEQKNKAYENFYVASCNAERIVL